MCKGFGSLRISYKTAHLTLMADRRARRNRTTETSHLWRQGPAPSRTR